VPAKAHRDGVVIENAACRFEDGLCEVLNGFSKVHLRAGG
jgi:hypothetical protein